jgi:hypothetical protein
MVQLSDVQMVLFFFEMVLLRQKMDRILTKIVYLMPNNNDFVLIEMVLELTIYCSCY